MQSKKVTIRVNQSGFVVYFNNDVDNFRVFRGDEPERFVKFITEHVAGIKLDQVIAAREAEIFKARLQLPAPEQHGK